MPGTKKKFGINQFATLLVFQLIPSVCQFCDDLEFITMNYLELFFHTARLWRIKCVSLHFLNAMNLGADDLLLVDLR